MEKELTMEECFSQIEEVLQQLESKEVSLEDSFLLYQKGMEHLKHANGLMNQVEKKVQVLQETGKFTDFDEV